jgi:transposase
MELTTILNRCHRFRGFVYEHARFSADKKSIEVVVRPRKGSAAVCSRCHLPAPGYDQLAERRFEFIPLWGFLVFLLYAMRRVDCRSCGVVAVEEVPWADGKRTLTKAYMLFLARWTRRLSWKETAECFRTSWDKVFDAEHVVAWGLEHRKLSQIDAIGVDEIQYAKAHKYLTLVYQIDIGVTRLLWVGKERTIASFQGFFTAMGQQVLSNISFICSDMWEPYLKLIREKCSEALHILDRFHIVAKMNKALDEIRAEEARHMKREGRDPVLRKSRWLLLKRGDNLADEQHFRLRDLLRYNLKTVRVYLLKGSLPATLGLQLPCLGGQVPRRVVPANHALPHRTDEEDRAVTPPAPGTHPQLLSRSKADFQRGGGGPEQQSQSHHEKIVRFSHLPRPGTRPLSRPWQASRTGIDPRFLLTNLFF